MSVRGPGLSLHEFMISLFIVITTPVGSHLLAKAARHRRLPGAEGWTDGDQPRNR
jgi:multicomponent K+:H+ antiporter subunit G